jgi:Cu-Zn family superoxide dismutase
MIRLHPLALLLSLALFGCDRPDNEPLEPVSSAGASGGSAQTPAPVPAAAPAQPGTPPLTDPATSPAPAGSSPTAPLPAGTASTDPMPPAGSDAAAPAASATVTLQPTSGSVVSGVVDLVAHDGGVHFSGRVAGLTSGTQHGFHVHETGDCSAPDASSAGPHFNPGSAPHGAHDAPAHHAGDLPSATASSQGEAEIDMMVEGLEIGTGGPRDVIGRALVVHADPDDFKTQPDGAAGARIGCGVIVRR